MNNSQYDQQLSEQLNSHNIQQRYFNKWKVWLQQLKEQRRQAFKVFQYQTTLQQRLLKKIFNGWKYQILEGEKHQQEPLPKYKPRSQEQQYQNDDDDDEFYKLGLAIQYYQKKTYSKVMNVWIEYWIQCKNFQFILSQFYAKFLLKKYFNVVRDYSVESKQKKAKKAQTRSQIQRQQPLQMPPKSNQQLLSFLHLHTKQHLPSSSKQQRIQQMISQIKIKQNQTQRIHIPSSTTYLFRQNKILDESRRSQFSTLSNRVSYESKRRYQPITEIPSIPEISIKNKDKQIENNVKIVQMPKSQINNVQKFQSRVKPNQQVQQKQKVQENKIKKIDLILELITKQKLMTLALLDGQQFQNEPSLQYSNYQQKTRNFLQKIKLADTKIIGH